MTIATIDSISESIRKVNHQKFQTGAGAINVSVEIEDGVPVLTGTVEGGTYRIGDYAEKSLLRLIGLNRKFVDNASADTTLIESAINTSLAGASRDRRSAIHVSAANDNIQSFSLVNARLDVPPTLSEVWDVVRDTAGAELCGGELVDLGRGEFDLRLITDHTMEPKNRVGDVTNSGVRLHVNGTVQAQPFTNRLVCTNGMTRAEHGDILHYENGNADSIRDIWSQSLEAAKAFNGDIQKLDEVVLPNIHTYVSQQLQIAGATASLRGRVNDLIAEKAPNNTLWEALQIVTEIARDYAAERPRKRNQIEAVAGRIVASQAGDGRCGTCNTRLGEGA